MSLRKRAILSRKKEKGRWFLRENLRPIFVRWKKLKNNSKSSKTIQTLNSYFEFFELWVWDKKKCEEEERETRIFHLSERVFLRESTYNQSFKALLNHSKSQFIFRIKINSHTRWWSTLPFLFLIKPFPPSTIIKIPNKTSTPYIIH